jgi:GNAT superfamily N-acetyltransferase
MSKSKDIRIRKFKSSDLDTVRDLIQNTIDVCYSSGHSKEAVRFYKDWHCDENVLRDAKEGYMIVLRKDSRIIGTGTFVGDEIKRVFVEPAFQRHGFGNILMQKLEEKALLASIDIVKLDATLLSKKFYDSLGYVTLKKTFLEIEKDEKLYYYKMEKSLRNSNKQG